MRKDKEDIQGFWFGYIDAIIMIMSIFLILYIFSKNELEKEKKENNKAQISSLKDSLEDIKIKNKDLTFEKNATKEQLKKINELQAAIQNLPEDYFIYQPEYKRFKLKKEIKFGLYSSKIHPNDYRYLEDVGSILKLQIENLSNDENYKKYRIKYLLVIEGMASKDNYEDNFQLSYKRALSLYKFWGEKNILPSNENCEIQIAGSGIDGIREYTGINEKNNQQFLIHIIPKMGKLDSN